MLWSLSRIIFLKKYCIPLGWGSGPGNKLCHRACLVSVYNCICSVTGNSFSTLDLPRGLQSLGLLLPQHVCIWHQTPATYLLPPHLPLLAGSLKPTADNFYFVSFTCEHIVYSSVGVFHMPFWVMFSKLISKLAPVYSFWQSPSVLCLYWG